MDFMAYTIVAEVITCMKDSQKGPTIGNGEGCISEGDSALVEVVPYRLYDLLSLDLES